MSVVTVESRIVVVLGRGRVDADASSYVTQAAERSLPLLLLSLGYPQGDDQGAFVATAVAQAFLQRVELEATLVLDATELPGLIRQRDDVTILATGRSGRRIGSVLARTTQRS